MLIVLGTHDGNINDNDNADYLKDAVNRLFEDVNNT